MGCDIHWVVERRHPETGKWDAVISETSVDLESTATRGFGNWDFDDPAIAFGLRSYNWFTILSSVRGSDDDAPCLAQPGLPDDASDYAIDSLDWANRFEMASDIHSQGWVLLSTLLAAKDGTLEHEKLQTEEARETAAYFIGLLETVLRRAGETGPTSILSGRRYDPEAEAYHPDMQDMSNHERIARAEYEAGFGPFDPENFRLIVGYDN